MNNMNEVKQEIISIKRSLESLDGKIISYLKSNPLKLDLDFSEFVVNALKAYWLPFVMHSVGVRDEELRRIAIVLSNTDC
ncbi:hypothetical protein LC612_40360 [Nostoc sp. CHAB 5834]|nr:hypothetical protein [Nostoc sp. CHAB 5834]